MITRDDVGRVVRYEPDSGLLFWRAPNSNRVKHGIVAGTINNNGHVVVRINGKPYLAHRLIWLLIHGAWPPDEIDHKNGNPSDNRLDNLRAATHAENMRNRRINANNTSGFKGVRWSAEKKKWRARIQINGKEIHLGYFQTVEDAYAAYCSAAERHHGEFARFA